jgi:hypothetical protein
VRSAGFPAAGLTLLGAPECARAADGYLAGTTGRGPFDAAFTQAGTQVSAEIHRLAGNPQLREAVTWQNLSALVTVDKVAEGGPQPRRNARHRARERMIARYWQRYCGKAETVGFFGPLCWATVDPEEPGVIARAGPELISKRAVYFDYWPLAALARTLADDPSMRAWLAPVLCPQLTLRDREVTDVARPTVTLTRTQAAVVSRCDGRRPGWQIAEEVLSGRGTDLRSRADVFLLLDLMVQRGILRWDFGLPVSLTAERVLRERISSIGDEALRAQARAKADILAAARRRVAAATGDPGRLAVALAGLEQDFTRLSGDAARRRPGEAYAGRTVCVEETTRDLEITFGRAVLDAVAAPLTVPLTIARWLCGAMAESYRAELERLYTDLAADTTSGEPLLGMLWFMAQDSFYGNPARPAVRVTAELTRRWRELFGLDQMGAEASAVSFPSESLAGRLAELFPAIGPVWAWARVHSPDLQFCAQGPDFFRTGNFSVVLGELHAGWAAMGGSVPVAAHPQPERLRRGLRNDLQGRAVYPLLPADWPRHTPRLAFALEDPLDPQLGFADAPGADPGRLIPVSSMVVRRLGGELAAIAPDGQSWPLIEIFGRMLSELTVDAFKSAGSGPHTPRISVDRLVVARETWRMTVGECPVTDAHRENEEYLAARRWKAALRLPDLVFVKLSAEAKPLFIDLSSPVYVSILAAALRAGRRKQGDGSSVVVSEMLPAPHEAWVEDSLGRRYVGELRLHIRDDGAVTSGSRWAR